MSERLDSLELEQRLAGWLRARDAGPAPERLRARIARVPDEPEPAHRSRLVVLLRATASLAAAAAVAAFVAVALSLGGIERRAGPGDTPVAPPGWPAPPPPVSVGALLAIVAILSGVGLAALVGYSWRDMLEWHPHRPARRTVAGAAGVAVAFVVVFAMLNVADAWRYPGGPLCSFGDCGFAWFRTGEDGAVVAGPPTNTNLPVGQPGAHIWSDSIRNDSPWPLVIEQVRPHVSDDGFMIDEVQVTIGPDAPSVKFGSPRPWAPVEIPATSGTGSVNIAISYHATTPGFHWFSGVDIDYRVGPFKFHATEALAGTFCSGPLPTGYTCPGQAVTP